MLGLLLAPAVKVMLQQGKIEQPLAGIIEQVQGQVGDLEGEPARPCWAITQLQAQLTDASGRLRPARRDVVQRAHARVVGEARHAQVRLAQPLGAQQPAFPGHGQQVKLCFHACVA